MLSAIVHEIDELGTGTVSFSDPTEEALVAIAKSGDERAFETLVTRYEPRIFSIALRYARIHEDAEDIVQQTFQKAFVYLHKFEGKSSFSTWLTRIAINEALMLLRKARALREVPIADLHMDEGTVLALEIPDTSPDPEAEYLRREGVRNLVAAVQELRPGMKTAIELREFGELTNQETARRMGVSPGAVKSRVFNGRRKLGEALRSYRRAPRRSSRRAIASPVAMSGARKVA